jgi:lectin-like protein
LAFRSPARRSALAPRAAPAACALGLCAAAVGCLPSADLDSYRAGSSNGSGGTASVAAQGGSGGDDASAGATGPSGADTALDLPLRDPDAAAAQAGDAGDAGARCGGVDEVAAGERCYLFTTQSASWGAARESCGAWGGRLMVVGSASEDQLLAEHLLGNTWIGLNDIALEGTFVWDGGAGAAYRNWGANEPNDAGGSDCVEKRQSDGRWYDQSCALPKAFACER